LGHPLTSLEFSQRELATGESDVGWDHAAARRIVARTVRSSTSTSVFPSHGQHFSHTPVAALGTTNPSSVNGTRRFTGSPHSGQLISMVT
jgi:hypothetical protein